MEAVPMEIGEASAGVSSGLKRCTKAVPPSDQARQVLPSTRSRAMAGAGPEGDWAKPAMQVTLSIDPSAAWTWDRYQLLWPGASVTAQVLAASRVGSKRCPSTIS